MELSEAEGLATWFCFGTMLFLSVAAIAEEFFVQCVLANGNPAEVTSLRCLFWLRVPFGRTRARLDEVRDPLESFPSLADFFCRSLKDGVRPIASLPTGLISPVDGQLLTTGIIDRPNARVQQVKGTTYSVRGFLGVDPFKSKDPKTVLRYAVIYLRPGDYHQVHSPCGCNITAGRHFPGELLPVGGGMLRWMHDLFCVNERVVLSGKWRYGALHVAAVGAANVGNIYLNFDQSVKTNNTRDYTVHCGGDVASRLYSDAHLEAGDSIGGFRLGSTVVLVFEAPADFTWAVPSGSTVRLGEPLGGVAAAAQ